MTECVPVDQDLWGRPEKGLQRVRGSGLSLGAALAPSMTHTLWEGMVRSRSPSPFLTMRQDKGSSHTELQVTPQGRHTEHCSEGGPGGFHSNRRGVGMGG